MFKQYLAALILIVLLFETISVVAQSTELDYEPKILIVTAHPDDDALFAATIWKTTQLLNGKADLAVVTNGEGGYTYSTVGNYVYGLELDKEEVGREYLPGIRKKELIAGGEVVGIRNYFFFDQPDFYYTLDVEETLLKWNIEYVQGRLAEIMRAEKYDFLFLMLPFEEFHGHHKASTVLALRALLNIEKEQRPIALQTFIRRGAEDEGVQFVQLEGHPYTKVLKVEKFEFDRSQKFGVNDRLDYNMIGNWVIAEHKSQGTMQNLVYTKTIEQYWYLELNGEENLNKVKDFFSRINEVQPD